MERTMKFKTLFLASAAALTSVSFAHAADAVMAPEPEPVEYVRVCDAGFTKSGTRISVSRGQRFQ